MLQRLLHNEAFKTSAPPLCNALVSALRQDNQENALPCLKTIITVHRSYQKMQLQPPLDQSAIQFLDVIIEFFERGPATYAATFAPPEGQAAAPPPTDASSAAASFKVLAEAPMNVLVIIQLHLRQMQGLLPRLLPAMVNFTGIAGPPAGSVAPELQQGLLEFRTAQVKTLSIVTWMLRSLQQYIPNIMEWLNQQQLVDSTVALLRSCPDTVSLRKELLTSIKQTLSVVPLKNLYHSKLDELLDESTLLGSGETYMEVVKPAACTVLSELLYFMRKSLSIPQVGGRVSFIGVVPCSRGGIMTIFVPIFL